MLISKQDISPFYFLQPMEWEEFKKTIKPIKKSKYSQKDVEGEEDLKLEEIKQEKTSITQERKNFLESKNSPQDDKLIEGDSSRIDGSKYKQIRQGTLNIADKIDLHGYNYYEAFDAFEEFVTSNFKSNKRNLLVITGKGLRSSCDEGLLRSSINKWVNFDHLSKYILFFSKAHKKHGGDGAFYIILKSPRKVI